MSAGVKILIVEDSPTQAEQLKHILERHGYQVSVAHDGQHALALISEDKPQIIVSDIMMPGMDGYELCRRIKSDEHLKDIPVLLLTSLSDPHDIVRGLECGADNFVTKPFDEQMLLSRLQYMLLNRELRKGGKTQLGLQISLGEQMDIMTPERQHILDLLISSYETAVQKNLELIEAQEELRILNESLEEKVEERTAALRAEIAERGRAEQEINRLNAELERRVAERTAQLEAANKELEAFSYSVSHDLRAPLRAMNGFSCILAEDYAPQLPDEAQRYLRMVQDNALRMAQLVDDLLAFSRLGRQPLQKQQVVPSHLVHQVFEGLQAERDGRQVEVSVGNLQVCQADPALLKQVYVNLLSNALKYTREREVAVIEVGCLNDGDHPVYFVRDNGAGFDMKYADKLFGVFQRLHSDEEFEGTGVGLAIAQRIVHRHGGHIWAEAETGKGATFYFTLEGSVPPDRQPPDYSTR